MPLILSGDTGVPASGMPTGSVIQVVQGTTGTLVQSSSSTPIDTGLTATITPKFATSKILVLVSQNGTERSSSSTTNGINLYIVRNSTTLSQWTLALGYTGSALTLITNGSVSYLDSPATTSATTYKTQFASYNNSGTVRIQSNSGDLSTITLLEIKA
jgi:hypothetical protein